MSHERQIVTGLASFGMSGKVFHAPLLTNHPAFRLKAIVERSKNNAREMYPDITILRAFDKMLSDPEIELIIVNTPDNTHAEYAHKALMAGKHVVVEKPFTIRAGEGEDLLNLARKKKKILTIFQNRRWDGDFLTVQKIVNNEVLGRLVEYEARYDRYRNYIQAGTWKEDPSSGTGTLYNLGSHLIDQALVLFGLPYAVTSDIRILRNEGKIDDFFEVILHYQNNFRASLKASYLVREPGPRYSLHGTNGSFLKYGSDPQEEALKKGKIPVGNDWGKEPEEMWGILNTDKGGIHYRGKLETVPGNYMAFYYNVYEAIVYGKTLAVRPEEAINVIRIIETAIKSNKNKRTEEL